jgi:hypothetical protein
MARSAGIGPNRTGNRGRTGLTGSGSTGSRSSSVGTIPPAPGSVQIRGRGTLSNPSSMKTGKHPGARGLNTRQGTLSNPGSMKSRGRQGR